MSHTHLRVLATGVVAAAAMVVFSGPAAAAPACDGPVAGALHAAHDATGDPVGLIHEAEETYCTVG